MRHRSIRSDVGAQNRERLGGEICIIDGEDDRSCGSELRLGHNLNLEPAGALLEEFDGFEGEDMHDFFISLYVRAMMP